MIVLYENSFLIHFTICYIILYNSFYSKLQTNIIRRMCIVQLCKFHSISCKCNYVALFKFKRVTFNICLHILHIFRIFYKLNMLYSFNVNLKCINYREKENECKNCAFEIELKVDYVQFIKVHVHKYLK